MAERPATADRHGDRFAGWLLGISAACIVLLLLAHPVLRPHASGSAAAEIGRKAAALALVHGALVVLLTLLTVSLSRLTHALGTTRMAIAAADRLQSFAWVVLACVGIVDGFVVADFAQHCATGGCGPGAEDVLGFVYVLIQDFTRLGIIALAAAVGCWSLVLVRGLGLARVVGALGLTLTTGLLAVLLTTSMTFTPATLAVALSGLSLWYCGVAFLLVTGALRTERTAALAPD